MSMFGGIHSSLFWILVLTQGIGIFGLKCIQCDNPPCSGASAKDCPGSEDACRTQIDNTGNEVIRECKLLTDTEGKAAGCKNFTTPGEAYEHQECLCIKDGCNSGDVTAVMEAAKGGSGGGGGGNGGKGGASPTKMSEFLFWTAVFLISVHCCTFNLEI